MRSDYNKRVHLDNYGDWVLLCHVENRKPNLLHRLILVFACASLSKLSLLRKNKKAETCVSAFCSSVLGAGLEPARAFLPIGF